MTRYVVTVSRSTGKPETLSRETFDSLPDARARFLELTGTVSNATVHVRMIDGQWGTALATATVNYLSTDY